MVGGTPSSEQKEHLQERLIAAGIHNMTRLTNNTVVTYGKPHISHIKIIIKPVKPVKPYLTGQERHCGCNTWTFHERLGRRVGQTQPNIARKHSEETVKCEQEHQSHQRFIILTYFDIF